MQDRKEKKKQGPVREVSHFCCSFRCPLFSSRFWPERPTLTQIDDHAFFGCALPMLLKCCCEWMVVRETREPMLQIHAAKADLMCVLPLLFRNGRIECVRVCVIAAKRTTQPSSCSVSKPHHPSTTTILSISSSDSSDSHARRIDGTSDN